MVRNTTYYSIPRHIDLSTKNQLMKSSWLSLHSYNMYLHPTKCICWCCLIKSYPYIFRFYFQVGHEIMNELLVTTCIWNTKIRIHDYIQNGILHFKTETTIFNSCWICLKLPLTRCPKWDRHFSSAWIQVKGVLKYLKKTGEAISWRSQGSLETDVSTCKDSIILLRNFIVKC